MPRRFERALIATAVAILTVLATCTSLPASGGAAAPRWRGLLPFGCANPAGHASPGLLPARAGSVRTGVTCFGDVVPGVGFLSPDLTGGPVGYGPTEIQSAYGLVGKSARGRVVAIVDAFDDPKAESDLALFRKAYGLAPCTTANRCFRKVNEAGAAGPLPGKDYGWAEEISLDLDAVSAACPTCHILLVEANSPGTRALITGLDTAVRLGAWVVSNSYGGTEDRTIRTVDSQLKRPGVTIVAASGDDGYGVQWPASSPYVTGVGGTTLRKALTSRGWTERAWSGAGSGCSRFEPKPTWQHDKGCAKRTVADVAADADPATGLGVYDTFNNCSVALLCNTLIASGAAKGLNGWAQIGGTSLAAPLVAAIYALAGNRQSAAYAYTHQGGLNDVTSGSNGNCTERYLCTAGPGYDGPTGLGTPHGLGAF